MAEALNQLCKLRDKLPQNGFFGINLFKTNLGNLLYALSSSKAFIQMI